MIIPNKIMFQIVRTIIIVGAIIIFTWNITKADTFNQNNVNKDFSASGIVSEITAETLSIEKALGSNDKTQTSYVFDLNFVTIIETKSYEPIENISGIKVGDRVIVKGEEIDGEIIIQRIISFDFTGINEELIATSTLATTSEEIIDISASSTESSTSTLQTITDAVSEVFSNVVDSIVGIFTGTSTETIVEDPAVVEPEESESESESETGTSTDDSSGELMEESPVIDENIDEEQSSVEENGGFLGTVKKTMTNIINAVTGNEDTEESVPAPVQEEDSTPADSNDSETSSTEAPSDSDSVSESSTETIN